MDRTYRNALDGLTFLELESFQDNSYDLLFKEAYYTNNKSVDIGLIDVEKKELSTRWIINGLQDFENPASTEYFREEFDVSDWRLETITHQVSDLSKNVLESPPIEGQIYYEELPSYKRDQIEELSEAVFLDNLLELDEINLDQILESQ